MFATLWFQAGHSRDSTIGTPHGISGPSCVVYSCATVIPRNRAKGSMTPKAFVRFARLHVGQMVLCNSIKLHGETVCAFVSRNARRHVVALSDGLININTRSLRRLPPTVSGNAS
jgi:hypothetical protein